MIFRFCRSALLLTALFFAFTLSAWAQTVDVTGQITDPNGAVVAGAAITITSVATGVERTAQTNDDG